jgi:hypothetical protein
MPANWNLGPAAHANGGRYGWKLCGSEKDKKNLLSSRGGGEWNGPRLPQTTEALIYIAMIRLMTRRLVILFKLPLSLGRFRMMRVLRVLLVCSWQRSEGKSLMKQPKQRKCYAASHAEIKNSSRCRHT